MLAALARGPHLTTCRTPEVKRRSADEARCGVSHAESKGNCRGIQNKAKGPCRKTGRFILSVVCRIAAHALSQPTRTRQITSI
ncbi:hypothetical protein KCP76_11075 [Salmonella enterica subsp. enterica serovar Weltevreden]|nr:hypothetical protein KCP76_11075 [Salmonella enterica subsp. enterica serovar Weltevreden]